MKKYVIVLSLLVLTILAAAGCSSVGLSALNNATNTPTRTPRPTFTPRASATAPVTEVATQVATDTPTEAAATDTTEATLEATNTPKPVVVRATKPPPPPAQPTQPPAPTFPVHQDFTAPYFCPQDSVDEVSIYVKVDGPQGQRPFAGGLWVGAFVPGGGVLKDGAGKPLVRVTEPEMSISYGSNCTASYDRLHPDATNGKIDVSDAVRQGVTKMVIRFIRSETDYTPISADVPVDFSQPGRWWLYFGYAGA